MAESPLTRSEIMRRVHSKDTGPEWKVRRALHKKGLRYRLHSAALPGKPDIVLSSRKTVIFIHGCFWHQHSGCKRGDRRPSTHTDYWNKKLARNVERDEEHRANLENLGWRVIVVWECEANNATRLSEIADQIKSLPKIK